MAGRRSGIRARSWPERQVLLQAALLLPLFWIGLRAFGLSRLHAWVARSSVAGCSAPPAVTPAAISALVDIAAHHQPFPSTCLTRSLVLLWLLQRRGARGELRIGVRLTGGVLDSHAWVEQAGRPLNDTPDVAERFAAFEGRLPLGTPSSR